MNITLVYISDELLDLFPGTLIAITYQNTSIGSITTRRCNHTNQIKAPLSENNIKVLGFAGDEKSTAIKYKRRLPARIIQNGWEVLNGVVIISKVSDAFYLEFYSGILDFVESLADETIDDLYSIDTTLHTWSASTIDTKRNATSGLVSPALSYGHIQRIPELLNTSFADSSVWEQIERSSDDVQWSVGSGNASVPLTAFNDGNQEKDGVSWVLRQPYKFLPGQQYIVEATSEYDGDPVTLNCYIGDSAGALLGVFAAQNSSSITDSEQAIPDKQYDYLVFIALLSAPGTVGTRNGDCFLYDVNITTSIRIGTVYFPSVYYKSIFEKICLEAGYTQNSGDALYSDTIFQNIIIPFSKSSLEYTGLFNKCREFKAELSTPQTITSDSTIVFDAIITKDLFGFYDPTDGGYDTNGAYEQVIADDSRPFFSQFFTNLSVIVESGSCTISISSQGLGVIESIALSVGKHFVKLAVRKYGDNESGILLSGGDIVNVLCDVAASTTVHIVKGELYNLVNGINQEDTPRFYTCEVLPKIKKKDFFKDLCVRFGLIPIEKNKVLYLKSFEDVISDRTLAVDWTSKRDVLLPEEILYNELTYAQNNYFRYPSNDDLFDDTFSIGNIETDNETLEFEETIYESIFYGSIDRTVDSVGGPLYFGYIPIFEIPPLAYPTPNGTKFDNDPGLRIMAVRSKEASEPQVSYNGGIGRSDYLVANFSLPNKDYLGWQGFLNDNYAALGRAIAKGKILSRYYRLTEEDISLLSPHKLMYDDGSYFLIDQAEKFVPGRSTKTKIFKVS